jgi:hypothetical protein
MAQRVADSATLPDHGGDHKSKEFQGYDRNLETIKRGANNKYCIARLKRDRPDIADASWTYERPQTPCSLRRAAYSVRWHDTSSALSPCITT